MIALEQEVAALQLPVRALRRLLAQGVPPEFIGQLHARGDIAVAQVSLDKGGTFQFTGPDRRLIVGVREVWPAPSSAAAGGQYTGELLDLVALSTTDENEWSLRLGAADFLGEWHLFRAEIGAEREVRLFGTPWGWLRAGGEGACVLDWTPAALARLRSLGERVTLTCDAGAGAKLKALLQYGNLPFVREAQTARRVA